VLKAFEMRAAGATFDQVRRATGLFPSKNSYTTFFNNTVYKGEMWFSGQTYPCPPIVTPELWDAVQRLGELRGRDRYSPQSRRCVVSRYLLSGLAYCQECGGPLYGYKISNERLYYNCGRANRRHDCPARHIPARPFERDVITKLLDDVLLLDNLLAMQDEVRNEWKKHRSVLDRDRAADKKKLAALQLQISRLTDAIGKTGHSRALAEALQSAERDRDQLEYTLQHGPIEPPGLALTKTELKDLTDQVRSGLKSSELAEKKSALRMVVSRVLARRTDDQIIVIIEYHLPQTNIPAGEGGDVSGTDCGPDGIRTMTLIIPIHKYSLARR
jgi:hypothetical protein